LTLFAGGLVQRHGATAAAFLVPGLALWLPSGYSYGALLLTLLALGAAPLWWRRPIDRDTRWLALTFLTMGALWLLPMEPGASWAGVERALKYLLATLCLLYAVAAPPDPRALWAGLAVGGWGSGLLALHQRLVQELERATGFTNAVQYGDLSLLLGAMCAVGLLARWPHWTSGQKLALAGGAVLALLGSALSLTRGGWLALAVAAPVYMLILLRLHQHRLLAQTGALLAAVLLLLLPFKGHEMSERLTLSMHEVQAYLAQDQADTSVGHRREHWRMAIDMGSERPWLGWGSQYEAEKAHRVGSGQADPSVLAFTHAHNETIDMFARRGLLGVALLAMFYAVPLGLLWPTRRRVQGADGTVDLDRLALALAGTLIPLCYIGFGLTQVFFAHNSGNLFYLFGVLLIFAALHQRMPDTDPTA
jgi:O-antigen ligase